MGETSGAGDEAHTHTHSMSMLTVGILDVYSQTQGWVNNSCRSTRNSFKRAVDKPYDKDATPTEVSGEQGEVDGRLSWKHYKESFRVLLLCAVTMDIEDSSPAMMSYSKNPSNRKSKKSGFFKKVFK